MSDRFQPIRDALEHLARRALEAQGGEA